VSGGQTDDLETCCFSRTDTRWRIFKNDHVRVLWQS
jgi:hypothetical protein